MNPETPNPSPGATSAPAAPDSVWWTAEQIADSQALASVADIVPDGFAVLTPERRIVFANEAFRRLAAREAGDPILGLRPGQALGCPHALTPGDACGTLPGCSMCPILTAVREAACGAREGRDVHIARDVHDLELRLWARTVSIDGRPFILLLVRDVSDEHLRSFMERLFTHDVMNLALSLKGALRLLQMATQPGARCGPAAIAERLIEEIGAQRDLTAAEHGKLRLHVREIDSRALLADVADLHREHPSAESRRIVMRDEAASVHFRTDPVLLRRVLGNMVRNALEATPAGASTELNCGPVEQGVEFRVHNPLPIPSAIQGQLFHRYVTTKGRGHGLGTYSMRLLTERYLGGQVSFRSDPGNGTTFFARYPLALPAVLPQA